MTEHQPYDLIEKRRDYEVRHYPEHLIAEVRLDTDFDSAGTAAFRRLVSYIGGANVGGQSIAMTAPVVQVPQIGDGSASAYAGSKGSRDHLVSFVLPASMTVGEPPVPNDPSIMVRRMPPERAAALRFSGRSTWDSYRGHVDQLMSALARDGVTQAGPPRFARFDPPWIPWFLRHNEVVIPIES